MTHDDFERIERNMRREIRRLNKLATSKPTLAEKIEVKKQVRELEARHRDHRLNYFELVDQDPVLSQAILNAEIRLKLKPDPQAEYYPLRICKSNAGHYIGRMDDEGLPYSRESVEYFKTLEQATAALEIESWTQRPGS